jgi:hypothetical protein
MTASRPSPLDLREIDFGLAAAETELSERPNLLLEGFLDADGDVAKIRDGSRFVILGPKGSGKSAIASRIELLSERGSGPMVTQYKLGSFPFASFTELLPGPDAPAIRLPHHWEFVLYIALIDSFRRDGGCASEGAPSHTELIDRLSRLGALPAKDFTNIVKQTSSRKFKVEIPHIFEFAWGSGKEEAPADIRFLFRTLEDVSLRCRPSKQHLIFIDGLDDIELRRERDQFILSALIVAADRLNSKLRHNGVAAKIVVLCRTDIFERLPGANQNKILQDSAVQLDWFQGGIDPSETNLARLVNHRAMASLHRDVDVFAEMLPPTVNGVPTAKVILNNTRHLPRDLLQLMIRIQACAGGGAASEATVTAGLRKYSEDYLVGEIRDEVANLPESQGAAKLLLAISMLGKKQFHLRELQKIMSGDDRFKGIDPIRSLERLFECSAVGTVRSGEGSIEYRFSFRYRNRHAVMNPNDDILVHRGLWRGLNLT